jgi:hypothetical protein
MGKFVYIQREQKSIYAEFKENIHEKNQTGTTGAEIMLVRLQKYADDAFNVTYMHKAAVEALSGMEDVDAYDHTGGYPEKPTFNL